MARSSRKILAIILSIGILATLCAVPMTVSAVPADETYDTYDVVTYRDLLSGGNPVTASRTSLSGNPKFAYNPTSPSYSIILKYRWTAGSYNTDKPYYVFYFDAWSGGAYPFCFAVKSPGYSKLGAAAGANGAWHLDPSKNDHIVQMSSPIVAGQNYDIEHGRLKVATGANAGKYYVYVKVDGELIYDYYYDGDNGNGTYGSKNQAFDPNYLRFVDGAADNYISAIPEPDVYDTYDEIAFSDLYEGSTPIGGTVKDGSGNYTYNATSPSYSVKFSYRWTAATAADKKFTTYFDDWKYPFCFAVKTPNQSGFGATAGPNGSWHLVPSDSSMIVDMDEPIVGGQDYDIEVGRLKVIGGDNQGKYYVYFKVNDELIKSYYYDGVSNGTYGSSNTPLSNNIIISAPAGNKFSAIPVPETYEDYDEVYYSDLLVNGNPVSTERSGSGTTYTYNKTSASGSTVLKFRYIPAGTATEGQISFDRRGSNDAINYMFGVQIYKPSSEYPNGRIWLRPGYGPSVAFDEPIVAGNSYDVEFARIKVATGLNAGKYYMYFKMNGVLLAEDYVAANIVDGSGNYTSNPGSTACSISNEIYITFWGGGGARITNPAYTETYEDYDEIGFNDLYIGDISMAGRTMSDGNHTYTYNRTSPTYSTKFKYRWTAGGDVMKFTAYFDDWVFPFCFAAKTPNQSDFGATAGPNGAWHLVPNNSSLIVNMDTPIVSGQAYDIEIGRLKVATGPNRGKYYVYFMVDDSLIKSYYYDGVSDGKYGNNTALSNKIIIASPAGNAFSAAPENGDLDGNGIVNGLDLVILRNILIGIEVPSGNIADFNKDTYTDVRDYVSMKSFIVA